MFSAEAARTGTTETRRSRIVCNPEAVATYSQALADLVSRYDLPAFSAGMVFFQGWAKSSDGPDQSSLGEMRRGLAIFRERGSALLLPSFDAALAEAEASAGRSDRGLRRLDDTLAELERSEQRWYEAEVHRIRAQMLLKRDPAVIAATEQSLQAAIAIAQSQKARRFELRAALSLAKLYRAANRDADAHAVPTPTVEGFPPTRQFPELTEAQALLAALIIIPVRGQIRARHATPRFHNFTRRRNWWRAIRRACAAEADAGDRDPRRHLARTPPSCGESRGLPPGILPPPVRRDLRPSPLLPDRRSRA
jgi:hypothetical protein